MPLHGDLSQDEESVSPSSVSLDAQRYEHRRQVFTFIKWFCGACYLLFLVFLVELHFFASMREVFVRHPHMLIIGMALFLVPSFILWTVIRSVYKADDTSQIQTPLEIASKFIDQ